MKNQKGFTLIELLIVISILGILTGLIAVNFNQARTRARDVARKNDLKQIQKALELYKDDQASQHYPDSTEIEMELEEGKYMDDFPIDPREKGLNESWIDYVYERDTSLTYTIYGCLENEGDADADETNVCPEGYGVSYTLTEP